TVRPTIPSQICWGPSEPMSAKTLTVPDRTRLNPVLGTRQNGLVPRVALLVVFALVLIAAAQAVRASHSQTLTLGIIQHGTTTSPHPPLGDEGDVFTTTLLLNNTVAALGKPAKAS